MAGDKRVRKAPVRKPAREPRSGGGHWSPWLALGMALCMIGAYFYFVSLDDGGQPEAEPRNLPKHTFEKTGAGANVDFTEKTEQIHRIVDQVLKQQEIALLDHKKIQKNIKRQGMEGEIRWSAREVPISVKAGQIASLKAQLEKLLGKIDAEILETAAATYQNTKVTRIDIGVRDTLEGEPIVIIADKIYLLPQEAGAVTAKPPLPNGKAKLALVIDDFGYAQEPITAYRSVEIPLTFAVLPNHPHSVEAATVGHADGRQLILHLPMEAMSDQATEEAQTIHVSMSDGEIKAMIRELTDSLPYLLGVNNHQGSRATSNRQVMAVVLNQLSEQGLFFLDSKTSGSSLAYATAQALGVPSAENELFIDNSSDIKAIKGQLRKAAELALRDGQAIAIGHARVNTAKAIQEIAPELKAQGITFVFVSTLLN